MALTHLCMANSKSYQALHTRYHNRFFQWTELTTTTIATNRNMVEVGFSVSEEGSAFMTTGSLYVFFKRKHKDQVVAAFKAHLPPVVHAVVGKVDVLNY